MSPSADQRENRAFAKEVKFLLDRSIGEKIRAWARARLVADPNASNESDGYQTTSLYLDTEEFDVFHRNGSFGRSKYRIRRYGLSDLVFLERKLKTRGSVTKRRSTISVTDLSRLTSTQPNPLWNGYWYERRLLARKLQPVCQIAYMRTARVSMTENGPIRLTLDDDLRALRANGYLFNHSEPGTRLLEDHIILELKYRFETPTLFKELAEEFGLNPQPVSKYRIAAIAMGLAPAQVSNESDDGEIGEAACA